MADRFWLRASKAGAVLVGWSNRCWCDPRPRCVVRDTDPQNGPKREPLETDNRDCSERALLRDAQSLVFTNGAGVCRSRGYAHELVDPNFDTGLRLVPPEVSDPAGGGLPRAQVWQY